ncbi:hypothetical protein Hdeb2414_s0048g00749211 [Helianthus debilis subsp. tardiflorus]
MVVAYGARCDMKNERERAEKRGRTGGQRFGPPVDLFIRWSAAPIRFRSRVWGLGFESQLWFRFRVVTGKTRRWWCIGPTMSRMVRLWIGFSVRVLGSAGVVQLGSGLGQTQLTRSNTRVNSGQQQDKLGQQQFRFRSRDSVRRFG